MKTRLVAGFLLGLLFFRLYPPPIPTLLTYPTATSNSPSAVRAYLRENKNVTVLEDGTASVETWLNVSDSELGQAYRNLLGGNNLTSNQPRPIPEFRKVPYNITWSENVTVVREFNSSEIWLPIEDDFLRSIADEAKDQLGLGLEILDSYMMDDPRTQEFKIWMGGHASLQITNVTSVADKYKWEILIGPVDENASAVAGSMLAIKIYHIEELLGSFNRTQEFEGTYTTTINLPAEAVLLEPENLDRLFWSIDLGNGTFVEASVSLPDSSTIVLNETLVVTMQNRTMSLDRFVESYGSIGFKTLRINITMPTIPYGTIRYEIPDWSKSWEKKWHWTILNTKADVSLGGQNLGAKINLTTNFGLSGYAGLGIKGKKLKIDYMWSEAWLRPEINVNIEAKAWAGVSWSKSWQLNIYAIYVRHIIDTSIFGIPFWTDLNFTAGLRFEVNATGWAVASYTANYTGSVKAGVRWQSDTGFIKIWDPQTDTDKSKSIDIEASIVASARLIGRLELLFYSVAGPFGELELYALAQFTYIDMYNTQWTIRVGLQARAGLTINIKYKVLGKTREFHKEWTWETWELWEKTWSGGAVSNPVPLPVAIFTYSPTLPISGITPVAFSGSQSYSPDDRLNRPGMNPGTITEWNWTFYNANGTTTGPLSGENINVSFQPGGWYSVCLTVKDNRGNISSTSEHLYVLKRDITLASVSVTTNFTYLGLTFRGFTYPGRNLKIKVTVTNLGDINETFYTGISVLTLTNASIHTIAILFVENLPPGMNKTLTQIWDSTEVPEGKGYKIGAEADTVVGETSMSDNTCPRSDLDAPTIHVRIPGDGNGDDIVNVFDLVLLGLALNYEAGDLYYNSDVDFNADGSINTSDRTILGTNWRRMDP